MSAGASSQTPLGSIQHPHLLASFNWAALQQEADRKGEGKGERGEEGEGRWRCDREGNSALFVRGIDAPDYMDTGTSKHMKLQRSDNLSQQRVNSLKSVQILPGNQT